MGDLTQAIAFDTARLAGKILVIPQPKGDFHDGEARNSADQFLK